MAQLIMIVSIHPMFRLNSCERLSRLRKHLSVSIHPMFRLNKVSFFLDKAKEIVSIHPMFRLNLAQERMYKADGRIYFNTSNVSVELAIETEFNSTFEEFQYIQCFG